MKIRGKQIGLLPALLVAVLSFGGFVGIASIVSNNSAQLTPVSLAKDGDDDGDDEDKDDDKDEEEDDDDDKQSESEKKAREATKKKAEREHESTKKAAEDSGKSSDNDDNDDVDDDMDDDGKEDEDENENELENEDGDDNSMYKDRAKTLAKLAEELAETEKDILEKQTEGVDVTVALARLAEAKMKMSLVGTAFDAGDIETAKDLSQEIKKMAHFAKENDLHDAKEVVEDVAKVSKRIIQTYGKISLLEAVGGDGSTAKESLVSLEADLAALKVTIAAGGYDVEAMENSLKALERKVKIVKSSVEGTIYALGGTDSKYDDEYEDESHDIAENLNDVSDIEDDNIGRVIRGITVDHEDSAKKVAEKVAGIDQHNIVLQTLFGTKQSDLNDLEQEIVASKARTAMLEQAAGSITDPDVKTMLLDQVAILKAQTAKLETFVSGQRNRLSAFGWIFNLFE